MPPAFAFCPKKADRIKAAVPAGFRIVECEENYILQKYLLIALGGSLGSVTRVWVGSVVAERLGTRFPYGTFVVNLTACLIIGFSLEFLDKHVGLSPEWRYLIPTGFIGAYSTFSTFEWETFSRLQIGDLPISVLYVVASVLLGLVGVWCGVMLARVVS